MKFAFRPLRRLCQLAVAIAFIVIPFLNVREVTFLSGNLLSFSVGGYAIVDPLAAAQAIAGSREASLEPVFGALFVLALAFALGRVFCSWLCPYGFLSELTRGLRRGDTAQLEPHGSLLRVGIASVGIVFVAVVVPYPWLNQLSMPGWYTRFVQHEVFFGVFLCGALLVPAALVLEFVLKKRVWCRYACPQSVLLAAVACLKGGVRVMFAPSRCTCGKGLEPCRKACSLELSPRRQTLTQRFECTNCGDCVDVCRLHGGALKLRKDR